MVVSQVIGDNAIQDEEPTEDILEGQHRRGDERDGDQIIDGVVATHQHRGQRVNGNEHGEATHLPQRRCRIGAALHIPVKDADDQQRAEGRHRHQQCAGAALPALRRGWRPACAHPHQRDGRHAQLQHGDDDVEWRPTANVVVEAQ